MGPLGGRSQKLVLVGLWKKDGGALGFPPATGVTMWIGPHTVVSLCSDVRRERPNSTQQGKTRFENYVRNIGVPLLYPADPTPVP